MWKARRTGILRIALVGFTKMEDNADREYGMEDPLCAAREVALGRCVLVKCVLTQEERSLL